MRSLLLITSLIIFGLGLVMIFSTTSAEVLDMDLDKSTHQAMFRQFYYAVVGMGLAGFVWYIGYQRLLEWTPYLLLFFTFLLVLVLIPGIGKEVNGSRRWLHLAGFSFQPSEFVKYLVPAFAIHRILQFGDRPLNFPDFIKLAGVCSIPMLLVLVEPNNGTAGVIGISLLIVCLLTQVPFRFWGVPLVVLVTIAGLFAYNSPYVSKRLNVYLHPELDLKGKGHQPYQAKIAAGSGQLMGKGPGNGLQKLSYLPEAQNDYIAAIFAEEFGFLGMFSLISLYALTGLCGFYIAFQCIDREGLYLGTLVAFLICFQAFLNLGVVSGLLPSTGLNLPLFSQGGSSLMANTTALGILFSIGRRRVSYA